MSLQSLECSDLQLSARLFSQLADAHVGIAGTCEHGSSEQTRNMWSAEANVERSYDGKKLHHALLPCPELPCNVLK